MDHAEGAATPDTGQAGSTRCPHARATRHQNFRCDELVQKQRSSEIDESQSQRLTGQKTSAKVSV